MAPNPLTTWTMLDNALSHFRSHIRTKSNFTLSIVDLLYVSNFKGGNASITEPEPALSTKLEIYSQHLTRIARSFGEKKLHELTEPELRRLKQAGSEFLMLTRSSATRIRGFGPSYASALLFGYFPDLFPVVDRHVLNGAGIAVQIDSQRQVRRIEGHYEELLGRFYAALVREPSISLRELDKRWFLTPLPDRKISRRPRL